MSIIYIIGFSIGAFLGLPFAATIVYVFSYISWKFEYRKRPKHHTEKTYQWLKEKSKPSWFDFFVFTGFPY